MKLHLALCFVFTLGLGAALAQERASSFDTRAAKEALSKDVSKTAPKFITKGIGGDPVTKRFYTKDAVVVTRASGAKEEHPYVAVPLLFRVNSDDLLDATSKENVTKVAQLLKDFGAKNTTFAIEGHASAEGDSARNLDLSKLRAAKIQSLLREQGVSSAVLVRQEGFGSTHAQNPASSPEAKLQEDRRVLVVKEK
jgi:outer membrane protein OmpA-like peptidoglycan-associated protein